MDKVKGRVQEGMQRKCRLKGRKSKDREAMKLQDQGEGEKVSFERQWKCIIKEEEEVRAVRHGKVRSRRKKK